MVFALPVNAQLFRINFPNSEPTSSEISEPTVDPNISGEPTIDPKVQKQQVKCVKRQNKNAKTIKKGPRRITANKKMIDGFNKDIDKQIDSLEKLHCDVTQLRNDQKTLERLYGDLQKEWSREYQKYIDLLEKGQKYSCVTERDQFINQYKKAVKQLGVATAAYKKNTTRINKFIEGTFKKDLANVQCN